MRNSYQKSKRNGGKNGEWKSENRETEIDTHIKLEKKSTVTFFFLYISRKIDIERESVYVCWCCEFLLFFEINIAIWNRIVFLTQETRIHSNSHNDDDKCIILSEYIGISIKSLLFPFTYTDYSKIRERRE